MVPGMSAMAVDGSMTPVTNLVPETVGCTIMMFFVIFVLVPPGRAMMPFKNLVLVSRSMAFEFARGIMTRAMIADMAALKVAV